MPTDEKPAASTKMKVYLASPSARPLFNYIVQEFGYEFCENKEECDIVVASDMGRAREEEAGLNALLRQLHLRAGAKRNLRSVIRNGEGTTKTQTASGNTITKPKSAAQGKAQPFVKVTKIPGMADVCEKVRFHRLLQVVKPFFDKEDLDLHVPETYILPDQAALLRRDCRDPKHGLKNTLIVKPEFGTQGHGIFLCRGLAELNNHMEKFHISGNGRKSVAQQYVENPLLLDGLKFDLRLYIVVTEVMPHLKALLYREGLARFCTTKYKGANHQDDRAKNESSHLTNYAINKKSLQFREGKSKRLLSSTLTLLEKRYPGKFSIATFWQQMEQITKKILLAISPSLLTELMAVQALSEDLKFGNADVTFNHVIGIDILLDQNMKPWLLELNATPSLSIEKIVPAPANATPLAVNLPGAVSSDGFPFRSKNAVNAHGLSSFYASPYRQAQPGMAQMEEREGQLLQQSGGISNGGSGPILSPNGKKKEINTARGERYSSRKQDAKPVTVRNDFYGAGSTIPAANKDKEKDTSSATGAAAKGTTSNGATSKVDKDPNPKSKISSVREKISNIPAASTPTIGTFTEIPIILNRAGAPPKKNDIRPSSSTINNIKSSDDHTEEDGSDIENFVEQSSEPPEEIDEELDGEDTEERLSNLLSNSGMIPTSAGGPRQLARSSTREGNHRTSPRSYDDELQQFDPAHAAGLGHQVRNSQNVMIPDDQRSSSSTTASSSSNGAGRHHNALKKHSTRDFEASQQKNYISEIFARDVERANRIAARGINDPNANASDARRSSAAAAMNAGATTNATNMNSSHVSNRDPMFNSMRTGQTTLNSPAQNKQLSSNNSTTTNNASSHQAAYGTSIVSMSGGAPTTLGAAANVTSPYAMIPGSVVNTSNLRTKRVFGGHVCTCMEMPSAPHFHIESEVDIRAKYGPIKTLLTDFSKTVHDPSSCFFMPNSAILANSVLQGLCLDHHCSQIASGRSSEALPNGTRNNYGNNNNSSNWNNCTQIERGEHQRDSSVPPLSSRDIYCTSAGPGGNNSCCSSTSGTCGGSTAQPMKNTRPPKICVNRKGEVTLEYDETSTREIKSSAALGIDRSLSPAGHHPPSTSTRNSKQSSGLNKPAISSASSSAVEVDGADPSNTNDLDDFSFASSPTAAQHSINGLQPHINMKGVSLRLSSLPNFNTDKHVPQLKEILRQNELFRSNQLAEPCQCPIILDVCSRSAEGAECYLKLYRMFRKIAELYVEVMLAPNRKYYSYGINATRDTTLTATATTGRTDTNLVQNNQDQGQEQKDNNAQPASILCLSDVQKKVSGLVRTEPKLFFKYHQMNFDTLLRGLEKLKRDLAESSDLLTKFPKATPGSSPKARRKQMQLTSATSTSNAVRPARVVEDTLGGGVSLLIVGLTALAQGGFNYYEDYDLALGVLSLIQKIRQ
ncbi:unnamed protein product [Amoebophrya sp. A120]|nr:unnamed protein product [Amoebophrya sp. A120]|eukprot:GSA120T00000812001.1